MRNFDFTADSLKKHLAALESLFIIYKLPSFTNPRASAMYKIFDAGVINALANGQQNPEIRHACLLALILNEIYAQYEYTGKSKPNLYYYRSRGGATIDLVLQTANEIAAIDCTTSVNISPYKLRGIKSFLTKYPSAKAYIVAPVQENYKIEKNIEVVPWNAIG